MPFDGAGFIIIIGIRLQCNALPVVLDTLHVLQDGSSQHSLRVVIQISSYSLQFIHIVLEERDRKNANLYNV